MRSILRPAVAIIATTLCFGILHASGPIAVYALVDKVEFEPAANNPERIRIAGVFITPREGSYDEYSEPQRGFLYLALPKSNEEIARREWADLKSVAGTRQVVGLGSSWGWKVRIRKSPDDVKSPDDYTMGNGMVRINSDNPKAKALLDYKDR